MRRNRRSKSNARNDVDEPVPPTHPRWWIGRALAIGLWSLIAVIGLVAVFALVTSAGSGSTEAAPTEAEPARWDVTGFAEVYVAAFVQAGDGDEPALQSFLGSESIRLERVAAGEWFPSALTTVNVDRTSSNRWEVQVAVNLLRQEPETGAYLGVGVRVFGVEVVETSAGLVSTTLPWIVANPPAGGNVDDGWGSGAPPDPADPLADTTQRFLSALLTGNGELDRFAAPGSELRAAPATFDTVTLESWQVRDRGDGRRVRAWVRAESSEVSMWLTYTLDVVERDGRWEVTAIGPVPVTSMSPDPLAPTAVPATTN